MSCPICDNESVTFTGGVNPYRRQRQKAIDLLKLALDFWSAPGIDMPDIDTFNAAVEFVGGAWKNPWDNDGKYTGEEMKPIGLSWEAFKKREEYVARLGRIELAKKAILEKSKR